jgi:DNA-directed RNA polymerase subunit M/transcription elongation factor TFIIS
MIIGLEQKATNPTLKTITFTKPTTEITAIQVKTSKNEEPKQAFNPASLGFACPKCGQNPCRCDGLTPVLAE